MKPTDVAPVIRLMRFQAQNYKCLRDVSFDLTSPLAVFVGRNNTGKSAILDVFDFIREAADNPINATQKRGTSLSDIIWRLADGAPCHMELRFDVPDVLRDQAIAELEAKKQPNLVTRLSTDQLRSSPFLRRLSYQVSFGPSFHEQIATANPVSDEIDFPVALSGGTHGVNPYAFKLESLWNYERNAKEETYFVWQRTGQSSVQALPKLLFRQFDQKTNGQFVIDWVRTFFDLIYHSSPHRKSEESQQIKSATSINPDGSNLVQVLHTLHNNNKPVFQRIERDIARLVEGVESLSTPIEPNSRTTTLIYQSFGAEGALAFPIKQTSAGTIQLLILLTQLHTQPENTLILMEEMETMLHPRAQAEFARILRELRGKLTILMSTHSSVIASETREDSLFLVKKNAGATQLERFTDAIADELVEEMGIRPSCNFESNTVVVVEGKFDERVYAVWMKRYDLRSSLIESGGYSNVQFYANAKILQRRAIRVEKFAVFDGDTVVRGDAKQARKLLNLNEDHVLELDEANLEQILAQPKALLDSFPSLHQSEQALKAVLNGVAPASLKAALDSILRTVGGYTADNAARLATCVDPPRKWIDFFQRVDGVERKGG